MERSVLWFVEAAYKASPPKVSELAEDELSSAALKKAIALLADRWLKRFDKASEQLAKYYATSIQKRNDATLKKILRDGGFSIEWKMTAAQRDVLNAAVAENVALIKSIPSQCLTQVESAVMRSAQTGRDLKQLSDDLRNQFGVTKKRAAFIARDQSNKVSANLARARYLEIGVTQALWVHSAGGKTQRASHVKASREKTIFSVDDGWFDPEVQRKIFPGELPNCKCVMRPILRGFS